MNPFNRTQKKWIVAGTQRAALLARVSTHKQLENSSPEGQLSRCRAYCELKEYAIVVEKIESISGSLVLAREVFQELVEMGRQGEIDVIVVDIPDRLGRGDAIGTLEYIAKQSGIRVEYARPGRDTSTIEGLALRAVDQLTSGVERLNFRDRSMKGKNDTARMGQVIRTRFRPFGYVYKATYDERGKKTDCQLLIVEAEANIVRQMFGWVADECLTLYGVTKRLNDMGIPPPSHWAGAGELCAKRKNRRGCWVRATVAKILKSRTYMGEWCWGKNEYHSMDTVEGQKQLKGRRRDISEMPIVKVPEVVSKRLWERVQKQLLDNRQKFLRPTSTPFLLRSRVRCAKCNGRLTSYTDRRKNTGTYYRCWKNAGSETPGRGRVCNSRMVPADILDMPVWDYIAEVIQDERKLFAGLAEARDKSERAHRVIQQSIAAIDAKNERVTRELDELVDMHLSGDITRDTYRKKKALVEEGIAKRRLEKADMEERLQAHTYVSEEDESALRSMQSALRRRIRAGIPTEDKIKILEVLRVQCIWNEAAGEVTVSGLFQAKVVTTRGSCGYQQFQVPFSTVILIEQFRGHLQGVVPISQCS